MTCTMTMMIPVQTVLWIGVWGRPFPRVWDVSCASYGVVRYQVFLAAYLTIFDVVHCLSLCG
jgi:hypothetical protein